MSHKVLFPLYMIQSRVAKTHRMPYLMDYFQQISH